MTDQQIIAEGSPSGAVAALPTSGTAAANASASEHEPRLSYDLFGADVATILGRDQATCLCVSDKLLALGTQTGAVYLLDYEGNKVKHFQEHSDAVTDLSFDADAETLASSSLDGYITTYNVYTNEVQRCKCQQRSTTTRITTVTLDPRHSHRKTKEFVYGTDTGTLVLSSKGWLGNTETILFQGRGAVHVARMSGTLLAWATESGLRVYNTSDHSRIGNIPRPSVSSSPSSSSLRSGNGDGGGVRCSLLWVGDKELLVGWGTHVLVLSIVPTHSTSSITTSSATAVPSTLNGTAPPATPPRQATSPAPSTANTTGTPPSSSRQFRLEVVSEFQIPVEEPKNANNENTATAVVVGVAPFGQHLAVLIKNSNYSSSSTSSSTTTVLKVFDRSGNELFTDHPLADTPSNTTTTASSRAPAPAPLLSFAAFYSLSDVLKETTTHSNSSSPSSNIPSTDYKWWSDGAEPVYFFICPTTITLGRPRSAIDRISWLIQRNRYYEAVQIAESDRSIDSDAKVQLGEQYLHYLIGTETDLLSTTTSTHPAFVTPRTSIQHNNSTEENENVVVEETKNSNATTATSTTPLSDQERLVVIEKYKTAAALCPRLLQNDSAAWERWVYIFGQAAQLQVLAPYVPTSDPVLSRDAYDMVLSACLRGTNNSSSTGGGSTNENEVPAAHDLLRDLVERWPHGIYDARALINQLQPRLLSSTSSATSTSAAAPSAALKRAAASLYAQVGQHEAALRLFLELRSPSTFEYIKTNALQALAATFAADLIELDEVKGTQLFVEAVEEASPATVVASLQNKISSSSGSTSNDSEVPNDVWSLRLYHYLDWLWQKESGSQQSASQQTSSGAVSSFTFSSFFSQLHIELCATHDPSRLMHILTTSSSYPLDAALQVCELRHLVRESVYLLGRMGSSDAALRLIITKLRDVEGAVTFVKDSRDDELWDLLISLTLGDAALTGALLDHAGGSCVDPLRLVTSIPDDIKIERLRDRLVRVITDFRATVSLQSGCNAVLRADCLELGDKLYLELKRALKTLFVLKPDGKWSTLEVESTTMSGISSGLHSGRQLSSSSAGTTTDTVVPNSADGSGFPFSEQIQSQQSQQSQQRVWIGNTKTNTSASRKMSLTPPSSVHTSPSKFPPSNKNLKNTAQQQQQQHRTVVL